MSNNNEESKQGSNPLQEVTRRVVITPEDVNGAADFWTNFEVPMPPELRAAFDAFVKEPTIENQDLVKLEITKAISTSDHEAFKDEMFKQIVEECRNVAYDMSFDQSLRNTLTNGENKDK